MIFKNGDQMRLYEKLFYKKRKILILFEFFLFNDKRRFLLKDTEAVAVADSGGLRSTRTYTKTQSFRHIATLPQSL